MNLEEYLTESDRVACSAVLRSESAIFSELVDLVKLSKENDFVGVNLSQVDFRKSDLRGFNFSHSNLIDCIRDDTTLIDATTIFENAEVRWVEKENVPIVDAMRLVETATSRKERQSRLELLFEDYESPKHMKRFLQMSIENTYSIDAYLDFCLFYVIDDESDRNFLLAHLARVTKKHVHLNRWPNKPRSKDVRVNQIIQKMQEIDNFFLQDVLKDFQNETGTSSERLEKALQPKQWPLF